MSWSRHGIRKSTRSGTLAPDSPEEAEYRQKVRGDLEKKKADKLKHERFDKIKKEEEERASRKPVSEQAVDLAKKGLKSLFSSDKKD